MKAFLRIFSFLLLILLGGTGAAQARGPIWTPLGPWGGPVYDLQADPHNPDHLYALIGDGRILESDNRGDSWHPFARLPDHIHLTGWAISPHDPTTLFAGDNEGNIYLSHDGGTTWHHAYFNYYDPYGTTHRFYFHPDDPDIIYVIVFPRLFVSCNGGWNWSELKYGVDVMLFHPENSDIIYIGGYSGVSQSWDGGRTWRVIGLPEKNVDALVMAPDDPNTLYAHVLWGSLYRSTDGGKVWLTISPPEGEQFKRTEQLAVTSEHLIIGTNKKLWISNDMGETWRVIREPFEGMGALNRWLFTPNDVFYVGTERGLFRSDDGGESWTPKHDGFTNGAVRAFAVDSITGETLLAGVAWHTLFKSEDGGKNWQVIYEDETRSDFTALAMDPRHPQIYYAAKSTSGVLKSEDGGVTWRTVAEGLTARVNALIIDPSQPERLLAGTESGVFRSEDGGEHWERVGLDDANVRILVLSQEHPQVIYAGLDHANIYRSDDGGTSWTQLSTPPGDDVLDLAVDPHHPHVLFAATAQSGLVKSADGGETWEKLFLEKPLIRAVALHPRYPQRVFVVDGERKVFASLNGGDSWLEVGQLPTSWVTEIVVIPAREEAPYAQTLFVATPSAGVYRYDHAWRLHLPRLIH